MAIRLMPGRYRSKKAQVAEGLFAGLESFGQSMQKNQREDQANKDIEGRQQETAKRALVKDILDKVLGGMDPQQAESLAKMQGLDVKPGTFDAVQPSLATRTSNEMGAIRKAPTLGDVPSDEALAQLPLTQKAPRAFRTTDQPSVPDEQTGQPTLPTTTPDVVGGLQGALAGGKPTLGPNFNPTLSALTTEAGAKRRSFTSPTSRFENGRMVHSVQPTQDIIGVDMPQGPTPGEAGQNEAEKLLAELQGKKAGGFGTLEGDILGQQETALRPAKVETAKQTTMATSQAVEDVKNLPANITADIGRQNAITRGTTQAEAQKAAAVASAVDNAKRKIAEAGVPPEMAKSFAHVTTTGLPYSFIDPSIPAEIRNVAIKTLAKETPGIRFINKAQYDGLRQVEGGRENLKILLDGFQASLPKNAAGRIIAGPANTLGAFLQTKPELAALQTAMYGPNIETMRATMDGIPGMRMTQTEITNFQKGVPLATDSWEVALRKAQALGRVYAGIENRLLK